MQVALLFLVRDDIPTEPIWAAFIAAAAELTLRVQVPPTRPAAPHLFPAIQRNETERKATCWAHGGPLITMGSGLRRKEATWWGAR
jgi:hypothetical protein